VGPARTERVLQGADGVPFFLLSYAQALRSGDREAPLDTVPWELAQGVRQRLAALPAAAQEVLGVAAVLGGPVPLALLSAVAAQPEPEVLAALEAACRARLLVETGAEAYQFAHPVLCEVVQADLGAARRAVLHRRVAQFLAHGAGAGAEGAPPGGGAGRPGGAVPGAGRRPRALGPVAATLARWAHASSCGPIGWQMVGGRSVAFDRTTRRVVAWCGRAFGVWWWVCIRHPVATHGPFETLDQAKAAAEKYLLA
jgi:hypothetical protein